MDIIKRSQSNSLFISGLYILQKFQYFPHKNQTTFKCFIPLSPCLPQKSISVFLHPHRHSTHSLNFRTRAMMLASFSEQKALVPKTSQHFPVPTFVSTSPGLRKWTGTSCLHLQKLKESWKEGTNGIIHLPTVTHPHMPNAKHHWI